MYGGINKRKHDVDPGGMIIVYEENETIHIRLHKHKPIQTHTPSQYISVSFLCHFGLR